MQEEKLPTKKTFRPCTAIMSTRIQKPNWKRDFVWNTWLFDTLLIPIITLIKVTVIITRNPFLTCGRLIKLMIATRSRYFSTVGLPFLPGFPYQTTFLQLAFSESSSMGTVLSIGYWLLIAAGFCLTITVLHPAVEDAEKSDTENQRALLIIGIAALFLITFFPEPFNQFIAQIQSQFTLISGG